MFDAVNSIEGSYTPYRVRVPAWMPLLTTPPYPSYAGNVPWHCTSAAMTSR